MNDIMGWLTIAVVFGTIPLLFFIGVRHVFSRKSVEEKYSGMASGGLVGVFDAVWSPTAHEASDERGRQQRASVPAPTPDKGPGRMDDEGRIVIEVD
ncbi:hypothetical protein [Microbacterium murale]|uniref:Uncharacterized protein n=1 Tax=Microbacterium murale TaxID=1081040 RepID=A0ABU0PDJ6_9MICO|nr:hypothetical protein [Microbacterium murale]MDQ0645392.1 hypothetical protein [Microbacterium murale]